MLFLLGAGAYASGSDGGSLEPVPAAGEDAASPALTSHNEGRHGADRAVPIPQELQRQARAAGRGRGPDLLVLLRQAPDHEAVARCQPDGPICPGAAHHPRLALHAASFAPACAREDRHLNRASLFRSQSCRRAWRGVGQLTRSFGATYRNVMSVPYLPDNPLTALVSFMCLCAPRVPSLLEHLLPDAQ